eukprot:TRINITY_DN7668_c0_g1_i1.p1 TRINITY_DN7668_c0_g1~~TRINITY_DN7668_c0_g1_i1.p1  ORF type:complete len:307 (+),score=10.88 TRINITY_DN7668_c0_g1_i1:403-1323(+)
MTQGSLIAAMWVIAVSLLQQGSAVCVVLPLGDSITQGISPYSSYRRWLEKMGVVFVGSRRRACSRGNPYEEVSDGWKGAHEGHCNWDSKKLSEETPGIMANLSGVGVADAVLLHIGSNDVFNAIRRKKGAKEMTKTVSNINNITKTIRRTWPNVTIFTAQIVETTYPLHTAHLNKLISSFVASENSSFVKEISFPAFKVPTHTYDTTHPNEIGEQYMAKIWFSAIQTLPCAVKPSSKKKKPVLLQPTAQPILLLPPTYNPLHTPADDDCLLTYLIVVFLVSTIPLVTYGLRLGIKALWYRGRVPTS